MEQRLILINLLIKLGVAAAVASALVRSVEFKKLLFREQRPLKQRIYLILWIAVPMALGVWIRFGAKSFIAGDLTLEPQFCWASWVGDSRGWSADRYWRCQPYC